MNGDGVVDDLTDLDNNGLADNVIANTTLDTDLDGLNNHLDIDSDNDSFFDVVEAGGIDLNGDGLVDGWADSDADGIADSVDVDVTGGDDADADGVDDFADADFVSMTDSDGDGIVDLFDTDSRGTGFLPIIAADEAADLTDLPDVDGNGVVDVLEVNDANDGVIRTGLDGRSGCSIGQGGGSKDPALAMLALVTEFDLRRKNDRTCSGWPRCHRAAGKGRKTIVIQSWVNFKQS